MKIKHLYQSLTKLEMYLWLSSVVIITGSFFLFSSKEYLTLLTSLIGVTALIFVAKGYVIGQILTVVFAVFYGIISFYFNYFGEVITYLGMTSPIAIITAVTWYKHPYKETAVVTVKQMSKSQVFIMLLLTGVVTFIFYFILKELNTANMLFSTISIATSFIASYLTFMRSPFYAVGYMTNDLVLIILWILATIENRSYFPMIICFFIFFINDFYGFINWSRMKTLQAD